MYKYWIECYYYPKTTNKTTVPESLYYLKISEKNPMPNERSFYKTYFTWNPANTRLKQIQDRQQNDENICTFFESMEQAKTWFNYILGHSDILHPGGPDKISLCKRKI